MSGTYQSACIAAADYEDIYVVDSRSAAIVSGILAELALEWAAEQKIINGIDGDFCPDQTINRETMAVMIRRAASVLSISSPSDWSISIDYTDLAEVSDWAVDGIAFCAVYEIMSGNPDGSFAPKRELTRAEAAAVLQRVDGLRQKAAAPDEKETAEERKNVTERIS